MARSDDTEITLGTGKILAIFFALVVVCALFFGLGYSMGRNSHGDTVSAASPFAVVTGQRPAAAMHAEKAQGSAPAPQSAAPALASDSSAASDLSAGATAPGYFVQVAAVSKEEDANALVEALRKKQYAAILAPNPPDKFFHVQIGPFAEAKDAETLRQRLIGDGYNPILKK
jgi:cell division septation protein DedD